MTSIASKASISDLNQLEEDDILDENPNLTAADVKNATEPLSDDIARLHQEMVQVDAVQRFILARSGYKRRHTRATTAIRKAIAKHAIGTRLSKTDLKIKRDELISMVLTQLTNNCWCFNCGTEKHLTIFSWRGRGPKFVTIRGGRPDKK